ncbi:MAG: carboxyl transferase [Lachnospiraceae bacterium]|nr:carboxyl transferase [Lachnospiraceae bacterium]
MSNLTNSSAGKRILSLLDENSFVEIGASVQAKSTDFITKRADAPGDGVIAGYGAIDGNLVYVYSQDAKVLGGSLGEMHARKIIRLYDLAMKTGAPVIGFLDSTGIRIEESVDALYGLGRIYAKQTELSGVVPQITAVFGNCGGGLAVIPELSDFVFMDGKKGKLFISSPDSIKGNYEEKVDTSSAQYQFEAGNVDIVEEDEDKLIARIRELVTFLPENYESEAYIGESEDDLNRSSADMKQCAGDTVLALQRIADGNKFIELRSAYAKNMVVGFLRINGTTIGAVANRSQVTGSDGKTEDLKNVLNIKGCNKAAKFVKFCDAFNIPILTLTNVKGYCNCAHAPLGLASAVARLTAAFASATVPKVNVITCEAFTTAALAMNSKSLGADFTYCWKDAKIGAIDGRHAAEILCDGESNDVISKKAEEYDKLQASSASAAARGIVDTVIEPEDTRKYVAGAFEMLYSKDTAVPDKKHSANI